MLNFLKILLILSLVVNHIFGSDTIENAKDKVRVHEIISKTMRFENYLTKDIHYEFWNIVDKHIKMNSNELKQLKVIATVNTVDYMRYFYEDMLISLEGHSLYKSLDREKIENYLLKNNLTSEWRIESNDQMIEKAIKGIHLIDKEGNKFLFTKEVIYQALSRIDSIKKRIDILFTR